MRGLAGTKRHFDRTLPVALRYHRNLGQVVPAALHAALLTHPDERAAWAAVGVSVAAARLVAGHGDFLPEVIGVLLANGAPAVVLDAVRAVPTTRREELPIEGHGAGSALTCLQVSLWAAFHEHDLEDTLCWLAGAGGDTDTNAAVVGGLLGARLGEDAVPRRWVEAVPRWEYLGELGERLVE